METNGIIITWIFGSFWGHILVFLLCKIWIFNPDICVLFRWWFNYLMAYMVSMTLPVQLLRLCFIVILLFECSLCFIVLIWCNTIWLDFVFVYCIQIIQITLVVTVAGISHLFKHEQQTVQIAIHCQITCKDKYHTEDQYLTHYSTSDIIGNSSKWAMYKPRFYNWSTHCFKTDKTNYKYLILWILYLNIWIHTNKWWWSSP